MKIALSRMHYPITSLGPGKRIGIWFQGCSIKCIGCISKDTWPSNTNQIEMEELERVLLTWLPTAEGITISGGEPFDQFEQLESLLRFLKKHTSISILVYSGYSYKRIKNKVQRLNGLIDALISEPFDYKNKQTMSLRGSDNQKLHFLTSLGRNVFSELDNPCKVNKKFDAVFNGDSLWLVGIGEQDILHRLSDELTSHGHNIKHSQTSLPEND